MFAQPGPVVSAFEQDLQTLTGLRAFVFGPGLERQSAIDLDGVVGSIEGLFQDDGALESQSVTDSGLGVALDLFGQVDDESGCVARCPREILRRTT